MQLAHGHPRGHFANYSEVPTAGDHPTATPTPRFTATNEDIVAMSWIKHPLLPSLVRRTQLYSVTHIIPTSAYSFRRSSSSSCCSARITLCTFCSRPGCQNFLFKKPCVQARPLARCSPANLLCSRCSKSAIFRCRSVVISNPRGAAVGGHTGAKRAGHRSSSTFFPIGGSKCRYLSYCRMRKQYL